MRRLVKNVADKTNNFETIDREYAYAIWLIEKEFNVGPITEDFLAMKFWNLWDKYNCQKYEKQLESKGKGGKDTQTFGR